MKKTLLAIGLLSSTLFSSANAHLARHRLLCTEKTEMPENAHHLSFFEVDFKMGTFVEYSNSKKQVIERINCEAMQIDGMSLEDWWKCNGEKFQVEIAKVGENEYQGDRKSVV